MRAKLHMYAMKFKPAIKKYREAWWADDPDRYEELNRCLRECRANPIVRHLGCHCYYILYRLSSDKTNDDYYLYYAMNCIAIFMTI